MKKILVLATLAAAMLAVPAAKADTVIPDDGPAYVVVTDGGSVEIWQETNGKAGLQTQADGDTAADSRVFPA